MKYITLDSPGEPNVLHLAQTEAPRPRRGEVAIAVEAAGVCRADTLQRRGTYPPPAGASTTLGLEVAGTISELGEGVTEWNVGDRVCALCNGGGYAETVTVPAGQVLPIPDHWSAIEAASLPENAFTVYDNLFTRARLAAGETVLVHGATSGIGTTAVMFARAFGARVIGTAGSPAKCEASRRLGVDIVIDYTKDDFVIEALAATQGRGVDVILDIVGGDYIARNLRCIALDGRIACIAFARGRLCEIDLAFLLSRRATIFGSSLRPRSEEQKAEIASKLREHIWPLLPARDPISPIIDSVVPFDEASQAHARMESSLHIGKIVLVPEKPLARGGGIR
ncbi:MAG TPA: NAD(P)H-quinone oxidoreductase [Candidatus Baltobacteraceae bacterium]|jgi:putative PIG3 family NAD(P)H quinone oxidoreductase|nr:NAD(P)H-quinone oxidoreductase [Candidatus Baltobacteraceae bacterium]